jgi:hypothetical protein
MPSSTADGASPAEAPQRDYVDLLEESDEEREVRLWGRSWIKDHQLAAGVGMFVMWLFVGGAIYVVLRK